MAAFLPLQLLLLLLLCVGAVTPTLSGLSPDPPATQRSHGVGLPCGSISLPPHLTWGPAASSEAPEQLRATPLGANRAAGGADVELQVWRRGDKLSCRCSSSHARAQDLVRTVQVDLQVGNGTDYFLLTAVMTITCADGIQALCPVIGSSQPLRVHSDTSVRLVLLDGAVVSDVLRVGAEEVGKERSGDGVEGLWWLDGRDSAGMAADKNCRYEGAKIELVSQLSSSELGEARATISNSIPFDACSCLHGPWVWGVPAQVSVTHSSEHPSFSKYLHASNSADIHAAAHNDIHEQGEDTSSQLTGRMRKHRVLRRSTDQAVMPCFAQDQYEVSVAENSASGTEVATVLATVCGEEEGGDGAEMLRYSILNSSPFEIDRVTGVISVSSSKRGGGRGASV